jgi:hypothetical protein
MLFHRPASAALAVQSRLGVPRVAGLLVLVAAWSTSAVCGAVGPGVREVIEFTRIIQPLQQTDDELRSQTSPDGRWAFIVTRRSDVATDTNRFDVLLLEVAGERLALGQFREPTRLFALDALRDNYDGDPPLREARWIGNRTIVFRARMHDAPFQAYALDVPTRRLRQLTFEPLGVVSFDITSDLKRVVYVAHVFSSPIARGARSVVVGTNSFWSIYGPNELRTQLRRYRYMVAEAGTSRPARPLGPSFAEGTGVGFPSPSISPDGRWVLLPRYEAASQVTWGRAYPRIAEVTAKYGPSASSDPLAYFSRPRAFVPQRLVAYRLGDGQEQSVLDAPDDSTQGNQTRTDRIWQGGGRSVVIAGTYLPAAADRPLDAASHIVEYWPDSGRWKDIAALKQGLKDTLPVAGMPGDFVAIDGDERRRFHRTVDGGWLEVKVGETDGHDLEGANRATLRGGWRLRVDQALNQPPDIVATGPDGENVPLTRLNPQYAAASWGTMREYAWRDVKGREWRGGLMVPAHFDSGARHALVVQTYGFSPTRFYRDGTNVFDGATSGYPGRALLRENILVLAMPTRATSGEPKDPHERTLAFSDGVRSAIESLVADGVVDRERVGLMGWSATGAQSLNLVTFTDTPIRATSLLDADANTLFSMTITYSVLDGTQLKKELLNEGGPYGESLGRWVRNDPSLHTDCIRTALRIEGYGPEVKNNWDVYALLRRQYRPVEMILFPQGEHALSRPSDRFISLQGNVDWFRFWLNGERRTEPLLPRETTSTLQDQYTRWAQLADLKRAADAGPACIRAPAGE